MSRRIDVEGPIRRVLNRANLAFDEKLSELAAPEERERMRLEASPGYRLGNAFRELTQFFRDLAQALHGEPAGESVTETAAPRAAHIDDIFNTLTTNQGGARRSAPEADSTGGASLD